MSTYTIHREEFKSPSYSTSPLLIGSVTASSYEDAEPAIKQLVFADLRRIPAHEEYDINVYMPAPLIITGEVHGYHCDPKNPRARIKICYHIEVSD